MCLISIAPKGTDKYSKNFVDALKHGASTNSDGSGYMYLRNGSKEVVYNKGFFDITQLLKALENEKLEENDILVVHHRIGTHGKRTKENSHPYCLDNPASISGRTTRGALAHNGVLSKFTSMRDFGNEGPMKVNTTEFSDSYMFVKYFLAVPEIESFWRRDPDHFKQLFDGFLSSSRLAFLTPEGLFMSGNYIKQDGGYLHSHGGYCGYRRFYQEDSEPAVAEGQIKSFNSKAPAVVEKALTAPKSTSVTSPLKHLTGVSKYQHSCIVKMLVIFFSEEIWADVFFGYDGDRARTNPESKIEFTKPFAITDTTIETCIKKTFNGNSSYMYKNPNELFVGSYDYVMEDQSAPELNDFIALIKAFTPKDLRDKNYQKKLKKEYDKYLKTSAMGVELPKVGKVYGTSFAWFYRLYCSPDKNYIERKKFYDALIARNYQLDYTNLESFRKVLKFEEPPIMMQYGKTENPKRSKF